MDNIRTVSKFSRAQLVLRYSEGESVTSTLMTFNGRVNEYITLASIAFLFDFTIEGCELYLLSLNVTTRLKHGQQWVNVCDIIPLFGWTLSG